MKSSTMYHTKANPRTFSTTDQPMYPTPHPSHIPSMAEDFSAQTFHNLLHRFILPIRVWRTRCGQYLGTKLLWRRNCLVHAGLEERERELLPSKFPSGDPTSSLSGNIIAASHSTPQQDRTAGFSSSASKARTPSLAHHTSRSEVE